MAHDFGSVRKFRYARVDDPQAGVWSFELDPPTLHGRESHMISLNGVNGWYFLSRDKMWR